MVKVDRSVKEDLMSSCQDFIHRSNSANLRERYCFLVGGSFICIEGNTGGWFKETAITSFSGGHHWVMSA